MSDIPAYLRSLTVLLENKLAANGSSDLDRRIADALHKLSWAVKELRDAFQADPKERSHQGAANDPRRQSAEVQDIAAEAIVRRAAELLPKSKRIQAAVKATQAQQRVKGRRAVGESEIDDRAELIQMARLIIESDSKKPAQTAADEVASGMMLIMIKKNIEKNSLVRRLAKKYRLNPAHYDALAADQMRQEHMSKAKLLMARDPAVEAISQADGELAPLVEKIKANAEVAELVKRLAGTRKQQNKYVET